MTRPVFANPAAPTVRVSNTMNIQLSTAVGAQRSRIKPNNGRMRAIRNSLAGLPCFTCGHAVDWSRETGQHDHASSATIGHVIAAELWETGGGYVAGNIGAQCRTCQYDAKRYPDLSAYVIAGTVPEAFLRQSVANDMADIRDCPPLANPTSAEQRRASRRALWGW